MIKVNKDYNTIPSSFSHDNCKAVITKSLTNKQYEESNWYKREDIKETLNKTIYKSKCAYCEGMSQAQAPFQVEHYRPKRKVKEDTTHLGYYWLAYEWTNLLWSCSWCNNYKNNQFPLDTKGIRQYSPPLTSDKKLDLPKCKANHTNLVNEFPLILNPELDKPEEHFKFLPSGYIKGLSIKGNTTIEICKLNREQLVLARMKIIEQFKEDIQTTIVLFLESPQADIDLDYFQKSFKNILAKIYKKASKENEYSRLGYFMFSNFNSFFIDNSNFDNNTKKALLNFHKDFCKEILS